MSGRPLTEILKTLQTQLHHVTMLEADPSDGHPSIQLRGEVSAFQQALHAASASLVFTQQLELTEDDFTLRLDGDDEDNVTQAIPLLERTAMQSFRAYVQEPWLLRAYFLHAGFRIEMVWTAPWWEAFTAALHAAQAEHIEIMERRSAELRAQSEETTRRMVEVLRARLPTDAAFIALACEARPRITAMRLRATDILEEELNFGYISGLEDVVLRELATQVRDTHRKRR